MRKILLILGLALITNMATSQANLEKRLKQVFSEDKVAAILENDSKKQYYNDLVFNSFELKTLDNKTISSNNYPTLKFITIVDRDQKTTNETEATNVEILIATDEFNILLTNIKRDFTEKTYYRIANTNQVLIIYPHNNILNK